MRRIELPEDHGRVVHPVYATLYTLVGILLPVHLPMYTSLGTPPSQHATHVHCPVLHAAQTLTREEALGSKREILLGREVSLRL